MGVDQSGSAANSIQIELSRRRCLKLPYCLYAAEVTTLYPERLISAFGQDMNLRSKWICSRTSVVLYPTASVHLEARRGCRCDGSELANLIELNAELRFRPKGIYMSTMSLKIPLAIISIILSGECAGAQKVSPPRSSDSAAGSSVPETTTATYSDWTLRCQMVADQSQTRRVCEVIQTLRTQQGQTFAQISIGKLDPQRPAQILVLIPHNVTIPAPISLAVDQQDAAQVELGLRRCIPVGCIADIEFKDEINRLWRTQTRNGRLSFKDGSGNAVVVPFSFKGLGPALDALAKEKG